MLLMGEAYIHVWVLTVNIHIHVHIYIFLDVTDVGLAAPSRLPRNLPDRTLLYNGGGVVAMFQ